MKKILLIVSFVFMGMNLFCQNFEGKIYFQKKSVYDTVYFTYSVKNEYIRVDEYNKQNRLEKSIIFDVEKNSIVALNPEKQLYTHIPIQKNRRASDDCMIIKSNNKCKINGFECYQWRVKDVQNDTETSYWVAKCNFENFERLLQLWHYLDSNMDLYLELPDTKGYLPMLAVERTLLRDERLRTSIIEIQQTNIEDNIFEIPAEYKNFQINY